jgi:hypothetical protein
VDTRQYPYLAMGWVLLTLRELLSEH